MDGAHAFGDRTAVETLVGGADEVLLEFAVGIGVGADAEATRWVDDAISAVSHSTAKHLAGLTEGERLTEGTETVFEVGEALGGEVVVEVWSKQASVNLALLQSTIDVERLFF